MAKELNYSEIGATKDLATHPRDAYTLTERLEIGGESVFDSAADFVLGFGMQQGAGYDVTSTSPRAAQGTELTMTLRIGPIRVTAPARVVYLVDEPDRRGFAYGTLQGHPESGEELFLVERRDGATWAEVRAFSRPGRWFTRLGAPVVRRMQRRAAARYLAAVRASVQGS